MYEPIFQKIGLAKNEAKIYETLLKEHESSAGEIANKSRVHRRNVYDSLNRLIEKNLVIEIIKKKETFYQAAHPNKLLDIIEKKEDQIKKIVPELQKTYEEAKLEQEVYISRGIEARKNDMINMLNLSNEVYFIGAKGVWFDKRIKQAFIEFANKAKQKQMKFFFLFDHGMKDKQEEIKFYKEHLGKMGHRFLPPEFSTTSDIVIYANQVGLSSGMTLKQFDTKKDSFTYIANQQIADSFKAWFKFLWANLAE